MNGDSSVSERPVRRRYIPLLYRVAGVNVLLLVVAVAVTIVVLDPNRVSSFRVDAEGAALLVALLLVVAVNVYLVRRLVGPVQALTALARRVDLSGHGERMPVPARASEAGELASTFNDMLARLEDERREATGRVLAGQEAERLRIAQELHDQVGQELTAVLLGLARVEARVPADLRDDVTEVQHAVRGSLEDVRRIAIELRPEALDDLGLQSALAVLCERFTERFGLQVKQELGRRLPELSPDAELVIYRVAQEALTNVARHSGAHEADLRLAPENGVLTLTVTDAGSGLPEGHVPGTGMRGMRERATLVGANLTIDGNLADGGTRVRLEVPTDDRRSLELPMENGR
ncbi:MAG TPA: histidine kinase [Solirubrobacteraceae bacterium]|jgi:two-component system, NarL family, sensor histidine kinase UhpB|nr:histidine kinase [Solirubrobacteraceae bacterium]